ncbi:MAG: bifunctional glutamate N-acetyltransferase/amino-acid acetyltransferase ArgJ [Armatimonadetes bacterium]|nr:bifunctional glutamate N-acetyltransferase/amino-acid acetyltransferase ArgJ [Armatimonadota bacterium]
MEVIEGGALAPLGFRGAATHCGIKAAQVPDIALLASDVPAAAAATITRNRFRAAPTYVTEEHIADGRAQAIIANSGNANCATGKQGLANARRMAQLTAEALGLAAQDVLVCSTGIIGYQLPMDRIERAIPQLAAALSRDEPELLARGIMTTDSFPKLHAVAAEIGGVRVAVGGIAKGAGMIAPNMATMLSFITTDASVDPALLASALRWAVDRSFNCISVDGCMSTNDTVICLANGAAGGPTIDDPADHKYAVFRECLLAVCQDLARKIAGDGEGATKLIEIRVGGCPTFEEARAIARAIANYTLLKVALHGEQFNWGRVVAALGSSLGAVDPMTATVSMGGICFWKDGEPQPFDEDQAHAAVAQRNVIIEVDLSNGSASASAWTCDLSEQYIQENAGREGPPKEK